MRGLRTTETASAGATPSLALPSGAAPHVKKWSAERPRAAMLVSSRQARSTPWRTVAVMAALACAAAAPARSADSVEEALRQSELILDWRFRYEGVDQESFAETAGATTSRVLAGFETAPYRKTSLLAEGVWIEDLVDDYNSTSNGRNKYPVVPDPAGYTAVNRFAFTNESLPNTRLTLGRQRIVLDDARFVGNVGWRQKEQTFDGLRAQVSAAAWTLDLTYANQVNRIFGPRSPLGKWKGDLLLANAARELPVGKLTLFGYRLDLDGAAALSTNTAGVKLTGKKPVSNLTATYAASYARQSEAGANPLDVTESYYQLEGGVRRGGLSGALGFEVLTGDGQTSFSTPLATLHAFQGWADVFLTTPAAGITDRYVRFGYELGSRGPFANVAVVALYHDFRSDRGSVRYGDEIDLSLVARTEKLVFGLKYATYSARTLAADTEKWWASLDFSF